MKRLIPLALTALGALLCTSPALADGTVKLYVPYAFNDLESGTTSFNLVCQVMASLIDTSSDIPSQVTKLSKSGPHFTTNVLWPISPPNASGTANVTISVPDYAWPQIQSWACTVNGFEINGANFTPDTLRRNPTAPYTVWTAGNFNATHLIINNKKAMF
jgi:hypothetical protein